MANLSERAQSAAFRICGLFLLALALVVRLANQAWLDLAYAFLLPLCAAFVIEYLIKVLDDAHKPWENFAALVHIVFTVMGGAFAYALATFVSGVFFFPVWFALAYLVFAYVINRFNLVWTTWERAESSEGDQ